VALRVAGLIAPEPPAGIALLRESVEVLEHAQQMGARAAEARAFDELLASGARPRRRAASGVDSLTPTELRVARMAADGMTNREIAQALFVTVKGVQWHLGNTYPKLGVQRDGLRDALERG
jgi:DNA-binding CsgD family transcriptional regulator